jgi:uncharacterized protein
MVTETHVLPIDPNALAIYPDSGPRLIGGRCATCGKYFFPNRELCTDCFTKGKMEKVPLDPFGSLLSYTVVRRAPGREVPYAIGYIKIAEDLVVFAPLVECDIERLSQGMRMEVVFIEKRDREGRQVMGYGYRPRTTNNTRGEEQ